MSACINQYSMRACCFTCVYRGHPLQHWSGFDSCCSSAMPIFAQEVCWLFQGVGGGRGAEDGRITVELWMSHSQQILSSLSLKCFYHCSHFKFQQSTKEAVIYWTIKCNLWGCSSLNHKLTNSSDVLERAALKCITYLHVVLEAFSLHAPWFLEYRKPILTRANPLNHGSICVFQWLLMQLKMSFKKWAWEAGQSAWGPDGFPQCLTHWTYTRKLCKYLYFERFSET